MKAPELRSYILPAILGIGATVLLSYAFYLQVVNTSFKTRATSTTIHREIVYPSRGLVYDRNGKLLIYNEPVYDILVTHNQLSDDFDRALLADILQIDSATVEQQLHPDWSSRRYSKNVPYTFLKKVPAKVFNVFQENLHAFPGFSFRLRNVRAYPEPHAAHVLGYIGEVNPDMVSNPSSVYDVGDYHGMTGLESQYEDVLRGIKGANYILKDNIGRSVGFFSDGNLNINPEAGLDLTLSLDIDLQAYGEDLLKGRRGSIVAIEPSSGEILAMVTAPHYDPNILRVDRDRGPAYQALSQDSLQPFFNRSVSAKYPPGSIFKPILSLIALQEDVITADRFITCSGRYTYRVSSWGCHAGPGRRNLSRAIEQSCNSYFYTIYRELVEQYGFSKPEFGLDKMKNYLKGFGLGEPLGIDIPGEESGLNPGAAFYDKLYEHTDGDWRSTYIISNAIGQGEIELTTLQMANLAATLANRGSYYTPHILKDFNSDELRPRTIEKKQVAIDQEHYAPVIEGMRLAARNSTAGLASIPGLQIAGKTGTSQNVHGDDHSVFYAFAPIENPKIAIAVYVENAGWGAAHAAPIASLMIEKYINDQIAPSREWIERYVKVKSEQP